MKKLSTLLLALLLLCSVCFAEAGGPFDVTLDPNYAEGAATTLTLEAATDATSGLAGAAVRVPVTVSSLRPMEWPAAEPFIPVKYKRM